MFLSSKRSRLNNCYCNQDLRQGPLRPASRHGLHGSVPASLYTPLPLPDLGWDDIPFSTCAARGGAVWARGVHWLGHRPFSEPPASAGELLHTPQRIPAFMTTVLLSPAGDILCGF